MSLVVEEGLYKDQNVLLIEIQLLDLECIYNNVCRAGRADLLNHLLPRKVIYTIIHQDSRIEIEVLDSVCFYIM